MGWYEALKDMATVADRLRDAELKQRLAALQVECAKLAEENAKLRQELLDLRVQVQTRQEMQYQDNAYWRRVGGTIEGPFCPKCLDGSSKVARMSDYADFHAWICPVCNCSIQKPGGRQEVEAETDFDPFSD